MGPWVQGYGGGVAWVSPGISWDILFAFTLCRAIVMQQIRGIYNDEDMVCYGAYAGNIIYMINRHFTMFALKKKKGSVFPKKWLNLDQIMLC